MNGIAERAGLLADSLDDLRESLVELTAVFRVKRQVLAQGDMASLDKLLQREEAVAQALFNAETRRELLAEEVAGELGVESGRLVDIAAALPEETADRLVDAGTGLRDAMSILVREARIVADICRAAMDHYDKLIRIVTGVEIGGAMYTSKGKAADSQRRNIIDQAI